MPSDSNKEKGIDHTNEGDAHGFARPRIETNEDNQIAKQVDRSKQEAFTSDVLKAVSPNAPDLMERSFQIVDQDKVLLDSRKSEANSLSEGDSLIPKGGRVSVPSHNDLHASNRIKNADGTVRENLVASNDTTKLTGAISEEHYYEFADASGTVPFGGPIQGGVQSSAIKSNEYSSLAIGITGKFNGYDADRDILNINISDQLKINEQSVFDGSPHRETIAIAPMPGASRHWKWVDATIQKHGNQKLVTIHRLSPKLERPQREDDWDIAPSKFSTFELKTDKGRQYGHYSDFWGGTNQTRIVHSEREQVHLRALEINEKVTGF